MKKNILICCCVISLLNLSACKQKPNKADAPQPSAVQNQTTPQQPANKKISDELLWAAQMGNLENIFNLY